MNPRLKQRLVGAAVLVALAVIFLPELLRSPGEGTMSSVDLEIPPAPEPTTNLELPPPPVVPATDSRASTSPSETKLVPADPPAPAAPADKPDQAGTGTAFTPRAIPMEVTPDLVGWVVQVGSFTDPRNAARLQQQLREAGFAAFTESVAADGRTWRRVRVGPELSRADAERLQAQLASDFGIDGLIRKHP